MVLGVARSSAYQAAHRGEIPTIRIGRRLLVPTAELRRMLALGGIAHAGADPHKALSSQGSPTLVEVGK